MTSHSPLYVDLDGTLIQTDLLVESFLGLLKRHPLQIFKVPFWLLKGKAYLKSRIAERVALEPTSLPYHSDMLAYIRRQRESGRQVHLATAANSRYAHAVAAHLGVFDGVLASDEHTNLSGKHKLAAIQHHSANDFVYAGNDKVDLPIWQASRGAILVNVPDAVAQGLDTGVPVEARFQNDEGQQHATPFALLCKAMRPHQWLKNLLVFLPLLPIANHLSWSMLGSAVMAFCAFCLCASSVYLINDLSDLAADRAHPRKCRRPFASGALSPVTGLLVAPCLFFASAFICLLLPWQFGLILATYWLATTAYTFFLKRFAMVDVVTLAGLYSLRVVGGAAAIGVPPSFWILAFSMFIFMSLALTKRYAELYTLSAMQAAGTRGRGYHVQDLQVVQLMGVAAGFMSVLVLALYINSPEIVSRYAHVQILWGICPLLMLWVARVWLKASRGEMNDDPLIFAVRDRMSRWIVAAAVSLVLIALLF